MSREPADRPRPPSAPADPPAEAAAGSTRVWRARRPAILAQLPTDAHAVVEASAGTGKTFTLEHLVVELLLSGQASMNRLLVVTFTERAAAELELRLRAKLRALLEGREAPAQPDEDAWTIDDEARRRLSTALLGFERATISTIHAYCQRVLVEQAFQHGRPLRQRLVDGKSSFERAFVDALRTELARDEEPQAWLDAWLEERSLADLLTLSRETHERGGLVSPAFDVARWRAAIREAAQAPIHARAIRPLAARGGVRGSALDRVLTLLGQVGTELRAAHASSPARGLGALSIDAVDELVSRLEPAAERQPRLRHLVDALRELSSAAAPMEAAVLQVVLPRVQRRLREDKASRGELDFGDLLRVLDASLSGPGGDALAEHLCRRHPVALIDEFQDTDPVQWRIFRRIHLEPGRGGRLVVIGDPKQAIYGFRGADVSTYLSARAALVEAGGVRVALDRSFRARPTLVRALEQLFDPAAPEPFFPGEVRYETRIAPGRTFDGGLLERGARGPAAVLLTPEIDSAPVGAGRAARLLAEAVTDEIQRLLDPDEVLLEQADGPPRPLSPRDVFVLARSAREGRLVAERLTARGISAALYKQEGLLQSDEAHEVRVLLAAVADPHRPGLAARAARTRFFAVPLDRLADPAGASPGAAVLPRLLAWKVHADRRDYPRLLAAIWEGSGLRERLALAGDEERALTNFLHLFEILLAEAKRGQPSLDELVHRLGAFARGAAQTESEDGNVQRLASDRAAVQVMTMHKAKGLEAEVVFLFGGLADVRGKVHPYVDDRGRRLFVGPEPPEAPRRAAREEARRLAYVALTRARSRLYVPWLGATDAEGSPVRGLGGLQALLEPHLARVAALYGTLWSVTRRAPRPEPPTGLRAIPRAPPVGLGARLRGPADDGGRAALRAERALPVVTSYSRMKAQSRWTGDEDPSDTERPQASARPVDPDRLPPGAATGRFLHEVLEQVDLDELRAHRDEPERWAAREGPRRLLDAGLERHHRSPRHRPHAAALVHAALTAPLDLGPTRLEGGLVAAERVVREMEFLFPVPADPSAGYVKGFIDVVFEHGGRFYVLDWKSDLLEDPGPAAVDAHAREHYGLQAELYALALAKLLAVDGEAAYEARFGGAAYAFVRHLDAQDPRRGQWFWRPSWRALLEAAARVTVRGPAP